MKRFLLLFILLFSVSEMFANHIAGGELFYQYMGAGNSPNTSRYKLTMRLFRDCHSTGQVLDGEHVIIGIFHSNNLSFADSITLPLAAPPTTIELHTASIPCLVNAPDVCFQVGIFTITIDLPNTADGYTLSWVRCCRSDGIANLSLTTGIGATFTTEIPGTTLLPSGHNSSPQFAVRDTALVCRNNFFNLDFGANDDDGDSLSYSFCSANNGGASSAPNPLPEPTLILTPLPYKLPYSGSNPLGAQVSINPITGKISGVAPADGRYVINVCVSEWRNGILINTHRKDFILEIGDCDFAASQPIPHTQQAVNVPQYDFVLCQGFGVNFSNASTSGNIQSYAWDFGVASQTNDTSAQASPNFTYPDTGVYTIRLVVKGAAGCVDTGYTYLGIYPGFKAGFNVTGSCYKNPFFFTDQTQIVYGTINSWKWDFGNTLATDDTSRLQNPAYVYGNPGIRTALLTVTNTKGCVDTASRQVVVRDIPLLILPFHDTLICSIDTLKLVANGSGVFNWQPFYNILNENTSTPLVFPKDTTTYVVTLTENSCVATDSITVNVVDTISVYAGADTTICFTDDIRFHPVSEGLQYQWTPANQLVTQADIKNAVGLPNTPGITTYHVLASVGKCTARDSLNVKAVLYPFADAGLGDSVCYGKPTQLHGSIVGSRFTWQPTNSLLNANTLQPTAHPLFTTTYTLTVYDTLGCPKPVTDEVTVKVTPPVSAFAGNDTFIVANQPLQLHATGGVSYMWSPTTGMDSPFIATPIVKLNTFFDSIIYHVKVTVPPGCSDEDDIKVIIFKTGPDIFIPSAFTPNSDGRNDVLRPIAVGIKRLNYFNVYNRWGQKVYSTSALGEAWNGVFGGRAQATSTFVYMAEAVDYLGNILFKKGTVVLIR